MRPEFLDCTGALEAAGGLADTPKGREQYRNYLEWLSTDKDAQAIAVDLKSADCKVTLAALLKQKTSATNVRITQKLNMGAPDAVSRYVSAFRRNQGDQNESYKGLTTKVMT